LKILPSLEGANTDDCDLDSSGLEDLLPLPFVAPSSFLPGQEHSIKSRF